MIIIFDKSSGDLKRFVTGTLINPDTYEADGFLNVVPGGKYDIPPATQGVMNLDENADPELGNAVAKLIYDGGGNISDISSALLTTSQSLITQKQQAIIDNLPSWQAVSNAIDAATTIAKLQAIIKKMARVEYWLAKNTLE